MTRTRASIRRFVHEFFWNRALPYVLGNKTFLEKKSMAETERARIRFVTTFWFSTVWSLFVRHIDVLDLLDRVAAMRWANMKVKHYMHVNLTPHAKTPAFFDILVQVPNVHTHVRYNLVSSRRAGGVGPLEEVESVNNARIFCYLNKLQQLAYSR